MDDMLDARKEYMSEGEQQEFESLIEKISSLPKEDRDRVALVVQGYVLATTKQSA